MSSYLKIAEKAKKPQAAPQSRPAPSNRQPSPATKATEATKVPAARAVREKPPRDRSDRSDKRSPNFTPLTVSEVLAEINHDGSGAAKNADLYRRGELSEENAVRYTTCAILHRRRESFEVWEHHAPAVRKALGLCIHELKPDVCKLCNGYVKRLIEGGTA